MRKKQARRKKRSKEKKKGKDLEAEEVDDKENTEEEIKLVDLFTPYLIVRAGGKIRSFQFGADDVGHKGGTQVSLR